MARLRYHDRGPVTPGARVGAQPIRHRTNTFPVAAFARTSAHTGTSAGGAFIPAVTGLRSKLVQLARAPVPTQKTAVSTAGTATAPPTSAASGHPTGRPSHTGNRPTATAPPTNGRYG